MGRQIIKQPNGKYAVFSSIVDSFVILDATPEEIIEEWTNESRDEITAKVHRVCAQLEAGDKPYFQFTMTWEEAVATAKEHGQTLEEIEGTDAGSATSNPKSAG